MRVWHAAGLLLPADGIQTKHGRRLEITLVVGFPNPQIHKPMPELVQSVLHDIGIVVRMLQVPDDAAYQSRIRSGEGDLWAEAGGQNDANPCFLAHLLFYSGPRLKPSGYARLFAPGAALDRHVDACREAATHGEEQRSAAEAEHILLTRRSSLCRWPLRGEYGR
ncbi:hypothetical protein BH11GEM1_BH11GEM1_10690 [soil metagenome]